MKTKLCRPILIECKESILHLSNNKLIDSIEITGENDLYKSTPQQLILISLEDEKIKVGDLVLTTISELEIYNRIETFENRCDSIYCKKVVATQDQLPPELIQQLIAEYNNSCMQDFEIEMEEDKSNLCDYYYTKHCKSTQLAPGVKCRDIKHYKPKLNNGFVCIVKKKPVTYTEEEVLELLNKLNNLLEEKQYISNINEGVISVSNMSTKKINELNKREEYIQSITNDNFEIDVKKWFEQNKKK